MKVDITINVYDVDCLVRMYLQHQQPKLEVGNITVKSWNATVLELRDGYVEPLHHVIRSEHSVLFDLAKSKEG